MHAAAAAQLLPELLGLPRLLAANNEAGLGGALAACAAGLGDMARTLAALPEAVDRDEFYDMYRCGGPAGVGHVRMGRRRETAREGRGGGCKIVGGGGGGGAPPTPPG